MTEWKLEIKMLEQVETNHTKKIVKKFCITITLV